MRAKIVSYEPKYIMVVVGQEVDFSHPCRPVKQSSVTFSRLIFSLNSFRIVILQSALNGKVPI
jgi:hypothetical protein